MLTIPNFMDKDDYLQNHVMRYFLKIHKLEFVEMIPVYRSLLYCELWNIAEG